MANPAYGLVYPFEAPAAGEDDQRAYAAQWRRLAGSWGDGIVNAFGSAGTSSFALTRSTSDRTVSLHLDEFRIKGIHFEPTQSTLTLTLATIATGSTRSDRLVAGLNPGSTSVTVGTYTLPPKSISFYIKTGTAVTSGTPTLPAVSRVAGGLWEVPLYILTGGNVSADALDVTDQRVFVAERLHVLSRPGLNTELNLGRTDGTQAYDATTGHTWLQTYPGGVATWTDLDASTWQDVSIGTTLQGGIAPPQYSVRRGRVNFRGEVGPKTAPWSDGLGKGLGQVPDTVAPSFPRSFPVFLTNLSDGVRRMGGVTVAPTGQLTLDLNVPTGVTVGFARLDAISYDLDA